MAGAANGTLLSQAARESDVTAPPVSRYRRREPERTLLHATVRAHWKTFLAEVEERGEAGASGVSAQRISSGYASGNPQWSAVADACSPPWFPRLAPAI